MLNVLADLAIEAEAATALALRLARAYDLADEDESEAHIKRLGTAIGKYHVCKRAPNHAFESLEVFGGAGFVEESGMPRLYREAPLCSIWEGSGNVMALDVLRALARDAAARSMPTWPRSTLAAGADARLDDVHGRACAASSATRTGWRRARGGSSRDLALALQGSLLLRDAPPAVADAFCAARLGGDGGIHYGTLPAGVDAAAIVARHTPQA